MAEEIAKQRARAEEAEAQLAALTEALERLSKGWLYWPAARQPDPRTVVYESRALDEIEAMARAALEASKR